MSTVLHRSIYGMNPAAWFSREGRIVTKKVVGADDPSRTRPPVANELQRKVGQVVAWCKLHDKPIRIVIYKPRQKGCSTITVACLYVLARSLSMSCLIVGGLAFQSNNLWKILKHYVDTDSFDWGNAVEIDNLKWTCTNGSTIEKVTAGNTESGRSGTYHGMIITELARWPTDGAKSAADAMNSVLGCVPSNEPGSFVIMESTANGPEGEFPKTFNEAATFEQVESGNVPDNWNGYIALFLPWFAFADSWTPLTSAEKAGLRDKLLRAKDKKALQVWDKFNLQPEQVAWYHEILKAPECGGDSTKRDKEYPSEPADGFSASLPSRFNMEALAELEADCVLNAPNLRYGVLEMPDKMARPIFMPTDIKDATVCIAEMPIIGCSYVGWTDNCKGITYVTGDDTDCNAGGVMRKGYYDQRTGAWHPPEPVCAIMPGNRWDMPEFSRLMEMIAKYYGKCMVVPEANRGEYLIGELRERGVPVYQRPRLIEEVDASKPTGKWGFETTAKTRPYIISTLAGAIKDHGQEGAGFRCRIPHILAECRTFIRHEDGTEAALFAKGVHDDFVLGTAIGITHIECATQNVAPVVKKQIPADLRRHYEPQKTGGVW